MKKTIILPLVASALISACSVKAPEESAMFDWFSYEGQDDAYMTLEAPSQGYLNPVLPGSNPDPSICADGKGNYYLVTTSFCYFPGLPVYHSRDLVNWKAVGHVLEKDSQLSGLQGQRTSEGIYAADILYNPSDATFYVIYTDINNGVFFTKSSDPAGSWSAPVALPGVRGIDPSFFIDDDGSAYVIYSANGAKMEYNGQRSIRAISFDFVSGTTAGEARVLVDKGCDPSHKPQWLKSPKMVKKDGVYWLFCTEGLMGDAEETLFRSYSPLGGFVPARKNPVLSQKGQTAFSGVGHVDPVQDASGNWWAFFHSSRPNASGFENLGNETFLLPVDWPDGSEPVILPEGESIPMSVKAPVSGNPASSGNFSFTDDFDQDKLDDGWMSLRSSIGKVWSLDAMPGFLTMDYHPVKLTTLGTPSALLRRIQHHSFTATARVYVSPSKASEKAGILLMKDERHQYYMSVSAGSVTLMKNQAVMVINEGVGSRIEDDSQQLASKSIKNFNFVDLRVSTDGNTYLFQYAVNGKHWRVLHSGEDASFLSSMDAGGFTGASVGIATVK